MALKDKMATLLEDTNKKRLVIQACSILQRIRSELAIAGTRLQAIADSGSLDTIDIEVKNALLAGWLIIKDANTDFSDQAMVDLLSGHISSTCSHCGGSMMQERTVGGGEEES